MYQTQLYRIIIGFRMRLTRKVQSMGNFMRMLILLACISSIAIYAAKTSNLKLNSFETLYTINLLITHIEHSNHGPAGVQRESRPTGHFCSRQCIAMLKQQIFSTINIAQVYNSCICFYQRNANVFQWAIMMTHTCSGNYYSRYSRF